MTRKLFIPLLALALAALACNAPTGSATPPTDTAPPGASTETPLGSPAAPTDTLPPAASDTPATPPAAGGLTLEMLRNGTYHTTYYDRTFTLTDGQYSDGAGYTARMLEVYAFGDLNGDHREDAFIIVAENDGGSGVFESLVAAELSGGAARQIGVAELGDRVQVSSGDIGSGVTHLRLLAHGPSDPLCCPSMPQTRGYWLFGSALRLMRQTSTIGSAERIINITAPGVWASVTNPFVVNGNVTVAPFENTLAYDIRLLDWSLVNESSVTVNASGQFSKTFNLSAAGITGFVIVQFAEYSAADGSLLTLGSVILDLH